MIIVDVNVVVYLLTDTPQRQHARRVREQDPDWWLPPLWRHELLNVLATLARRQVLDADGALLVWRNAIALLGSREWEPDMERALGLAVEHGISAYDAQYAALAASLGVPLVTEDRKLQRALPEQALSMAGFAASVPDGDGGE